MKKLLITTGAAAFAIGAAHAITYTVGAGDTQTATGVTYSERVEKLGDGTLVFTGNNSLSTLSSSAGTVNVHGGTTTISGSGSDGEGANAAFVNQGSEFIVDGGGTVNLTGGAYGHTDNGVLLVTNGTFDATGLSGEFRNGSTGSFSSSRIVIDNGGVVKAGTLRPVGGEAGTESKKESFGVDLNAGGSLYVNTFCVDDGSCYGRINFNGGVLYPTQNGTSDATTHLFSGDDNNTTWTQSMVTPTVLKGGCHIELSSQNFVNPAFKSGVGEGETDGGVHIRGGSVLYWRAKDSTYNGGTWLEGNGIFALNRSAGDSSLGALPKSPATNIWITSSGHILFSEDGTTSIHPNRMVFVQSGKTFNVGTQGRLVIGGEIKTEPSPGLDYTTSNLLDVRGEWQGTVAIGPGNGITNDLGRVKVGACLEVMSGVFRIASGDERMGDHNLPEVLHVRGDSMSYKSRSGRLLMTAGELYAPQSGRYAEVCNFGQVDVVGGKINTPNIYWLFGLTGRAKLNVSNGGEFISGALRLGQFSGAPTEFNLGSGGLIRPLRLEVEFSYRQNVAFNFNGGHFQSGAYQDFAGSTLFVQPANGMWDGVKFYVCEGGAVLDTTNGKHIWWSRPFISGAEQDGGLTCIVASKSVVLCDNAAGSTYNGPTRVICAPGYQNGFLQCRVANALPATTTLQLGTNTAIGINSEWSDNRDRDLAQTVARVEGVGQVEKNTKLVVTDGISPVFDGAYGTLTFTEPCSLSGDYVIVGDAAGCGCVKFDKNQDVSNLTLKFADVTAMNQEAKGSFYKIVDAPNGITGTFRLASDWPSGWSLKYSSDGKSVYVHYPKGTTIIVR